MAALAEHPLVGEACLMGFDPDHAVAALMSLADTTTGGDSRKLTVQMHGDAFVNFLFSFQPAQNKQQQQQQQQPLHTQNQQQQAPGRQQPQRGCKRSTPEADASESSEGISLADSDFVAEGCVQSPEKPWTDSTHSRQRTQQPGKRLRRSCEAAPRPPPAAAAAAGDDLADDPAVQITKHRRRVLQDSSSDGEGTEDRLRLAAAAASAGGRTDTRSRYQQAAAKAGRKSWPAAAGAGAEDLDCIITQSTPAFVGAAAGRAGSRSIPGTQQQTQQLPLVKQSQQKQKKAAAAAAAGTVPVGQSKLDRFFTPAGRTATATPAQQQQQRGRAPGRAAGPPATATAADASAARAVPSPLSLTRVTNSSRRSGSSFASLLQVSAEGGPALLRTPAGGGYKTPAAGLRGPASLATPASGFSCGAGAGRQQQGQAAAVAPWWQPLTDAEAELDQYDLVNLKVFGHSSFRPAQKAIVQQAVQGRDLFVLMATGGGKSLCYQLPAVMARGVTVVVCPLLSLMQDQVRALCQNPNGGIPATFLSSQQSESEAVAVKKELTKALPSVKLLYVTPEQLVKSNGLRRILQRLCQNGLLARFVIDEAHCVSTWGHDFRPDYKGLKVLRTEFKQTPITAVTATATSAVQADIISTLGITRTVTVHQTSFLRPNLLLKVVPKVREVDEDSGMPLFMVKLIQYIKNQQARAAAGAAAAGAPCIKQEQRQQQVPAAAKASCSGIVYCLSRKEAEGVAAALREQGGLAAQHYHAGMTPKQRTEVQNAFFSGAVQVIVATIAFGMGIDKPDVRFVVHFCLSKSLEGYYQEAGRAGRDGAPAECVLMYSPADINRHMHILRMSMGGSGSTRRFSAAVDQLETMRTYALNPDKTCRHAQLLEYFGVLNKDLPSRKCDVSCDVCRGEVVPLNPEEWTAADDGDGLSAEELDACIDLLEEDEEDEQQQQRQQDQQQQRSGGRRRRPLYDAAAGGGSDQDQAQGVMSEDDDSVEIVGSGSEGSMGDGSGSEGDSGDEGSSGSGSSSQGWDDEQEGGPGEACSPGNSAEDAGAAAVGGGAAAGSGGSGRQRGGNISSSRSHAGQQDSRQQHGREQQQHVRKQQQHKRVRIPQEQQQQQQQKAPMFQGFQKASQLQQQQQPSRQQPPQPQAHQPLQQQQRQPQQGGFQRASDMQYQQQQQQQQQQPHGGPQRAAEQQQQHGQGPGQAGLGRGSSRFNRVLPASLSRLKPPQQQQQQQPGLQPGPAAASGFDSAAALLQTSRGPSSSSSGRAAPASTASAAAAQDPAAKAGSGVSGGAEGLAAPEGVRVGQWVTKKRLGMAGSNGSGGSRRPSPAEALARELQSADDDDIF